MNITKINDAFSVCPQLRVEDLETVKELGFRQIIINRPDGEGKGQPTHTEIENAAKPLDLAVFYVPVVLGGITDEDVAAFEGAMADNPGPTLAYCKSGMRAHKLWEISSGELSVRPTIFASLLKTAKDHIQRTD